MHENPIEMCQNHVPNNSIFFCATGVRSPEVGGVSCEINFELQNILKEFIYLVCQKSTAK